MMDLINQNWWMILIAVAVVAAIILFLLLRPRQRVTLTDSAPIRPHMVHAQSAGAALPRAADTALPATAGEDDLCRMKGVGAKFAAALRASGVQAFEDLAKLTPDEVEALDDRLGPFRGRIARDRVIEQARFLAADDRAGFEAKFGRL